MSEEVRGVVAKGVKQPVAVETIVVPDPGQVPSLLAIEIASLEAANAAFELALRRHLLPLARAPPVFEIPA